MNIYNNGKQCIGTDCKSAPAGAGKDYTYFDMGSEWDKAKALIGSNDDELWKINKQFIDRQRALNKEFYFSHDPTSPLYKMGFYEKEINYLTIELKGTIVKINNNTWKIQF